MAGDSLKASEEGPGTHQVLPTQRRVLLLRKPLQAPCQNEKAVSR